MIDAILKGKLSIHQENMEDILTSVVFGMLKFVDAKEGLIPFLSRAVKADGQTLKDIIDGCTGGEYDFWPYYKYYERPCEPDVVITLKGGPKPILVVVEAKYRSGKSSESDDTLLVNDQLAREYMNLLEYSRRISAEPVLIYLTQDVGRPHDEIARSLHEIEKKHADQAAVDIYWLSWRHLTELPTQGNVILEELVSLLEKKLRLFFYRGVSRFDAVGEVAWCFSQCYTWVCRSAGDLRYEYGGRNGQ